MPDLSGGWSGADWGVVTLRRAGEGFEGTYTGTYGKDVGRIRLWFSSRSGTFEGVWSEGRYRFGRVSVRMSSGKSAEGSYNADAKCEYNPGSPAALAFQWARAAR
jgi:hypothetical protein